jgi:hypothetical protein
MLYLRSPMKVCPEPSITPLLYLIDIAAAEDKSTTTITLQIDFQRGYALLLESLIHPPAHCPGFLLVDLLMATRPKSNPTPGICRGAMDGSGDDGGGGVVEGICNFRCINAKLVLYELLYGLDTFLRFAYPLFCSRKRTFNTCKEVFKLHLHVRT